MTQSLWDLALRQKLLKQEKNRPNESVLVFAGARSCGKTTIINNFLEKDENPKPTLALEYNFARKSLGPYVAKSVAHIWELGGGPKLSNLLDVTVTKDSIE
nr:unnamed protein product [Spirometra erinaceieuropaei]